MARNVLPVYVVDAFTPIPLTGNPAGVVILDDQPEPPVAWMQAVAAEMRHAETVFIRTRSRQDSHWDLDLRWFTPEAEMDLCGHATLAAAHTVWERQLQSSPQPHAPTPRLTFQTRSGELVCTREGSRIAMDFPSIPAHPAVAPEGLLAALGCRPVAIARSKYDILVEVKSEDEIRRLRPDLKRLRDIDTRGVIVATANQGMYDVVSRFFAPRVGVDEDPVTGSAHCTLTPYFAPRLGKSELRCYQASPRGGVVNTRLDGQRVHLSGEAITVLKGTLLGWKG
jgi:PhzF family phenazine biosynthesis protein